MLGITEAIADTHYDLTTQFDAASQYHQVVSDARSAALAGSVIGEVGENDLYFK